jgi:alpha-tubulin suppressor-like RCC1 family protein
MQCTRWSQPARRNKNRARIVAAAGLVGATLLGAAPSARADTAYGFGWNILGELGNGTTTNATTPTPFSVLDNSVTAIGAGAAHSLLVDNGVLYTAGYNQFGQLGNGTADTSSHPLPMTTSGLISGVTAVKGGYLFSLAIANGGVYFFGGSLRGEAGNGAAPGGEVTVPTLINTLSSGVTAIAAGEINAVAIKNGALYAWGDDAAGQVGNGATIDGITVPPDVTTPYAVPSMASGVTSIASGYQHALAVMNGAAYAFGFNNYGQLGINGNTGESVSSAYSTPQPVVGLPAGIPVTSVTAGNNSSMALVQGVVYAWGQNEYGQLGNGTTSGVTAGNQTPTAVTGITGFITNVVYGTYSAYALGADGTLWTWGRNNYGQLGIGSMTDQNTPQQILPPAGMVFTSVAAGGYTFHAVVTEAAAPSSWAVDSSGN